MVNCRLFFFSHMVTSEIMWTRQSCEFPHFRYKKREMCQKLYISVILKDCIKTRNMFKVKNP